MNMIARILFVCFFVAHRDALVDGQQRRIPTNPIALQAMKYWTPENIAKAEPLEMFLEAEEEELSIDIGLTAAANSAVAGGSSGTATNAEKQAQEEDISRRRSLVDAPANGTEHDKGLLPPASPRDLENVRNEDWTFGGKVQDAVGRIFFSIGESNYFCTGTVVTSGYSDRTIILTAAHCVFNIDTGAFIENVLFIPNQDGTTNTGSDTDCVGFHFCCSTSHHLLLLSNVFDFLCCCFSPCCRHRRGSVWLIAGVH